MIDQEKRAFGKWWVWILALFVLTILTLSAVNFLGLFGGTVAERVIFFHSFQKQAGDAHAVSVMEANVAEIEARLADPNLPENIKTDLRAQLSGLRAQIRARSQ